MTTELEIIQKMNFEVRTILKNLNINSVILRAQKKQSYKKNMSQARNNRLNGLINFCKKKNFTSIFGSSL